ncbi:hypothetical protein FSP39_023329 [Pinctada imbricata]|uniref:MULE transposase domain-containing protein n=1 Tax=Pinctada imbricata TaxID=66713 RepID=A0AA89C8L2_PINIB|nr:hypothetical protein FSP39_023329 [Pinctada imbricata]
MTPIPSIYDEEITKLRDAPWDSQTREVASKLPTFSATKSAIYRARQKTVPPIPSTRQTIQLSDKFQRSTSGELFLQADADRILIFASPDNVEHLCAAPDIYCDGTFYTAPSMFDSIFTIHAFVGDVMFPLVYSLLPKRDTATYTRFFTLFKDLATRHNQQLTPTTINLDFESASRNAATQAFPNVQLKGCLFHFTKAIWRKTQSLGMQVDYRNQQDVQLLVRRMKAPPLIPLPNLDDYWLHAVADAPPRTDCT